MSDDRPEELCDNCDAPVHPDSKGWWVDDDGSSDCVIGLGVHLVNGLPG